MSRTIVDWVARAWSRDAERVAVRCGEARITYDELDHRSAQVATMLARHGAARGDIIGVHLPRSVDLVVGLFGVLHAGCAYLPLDPAYPGARQAAMITDTDARIVLSTHDAPVAIEPHSFVPARTILAVEDAAPVAPADLPSLLAGDLAYVIYTSGSTGLPKAVAIEHRNVVSLLEAFVAITRITANDVLLSVSSLLFDIAGLELFLPLGVGATVVIAENNPAQDPDALLDEIARRSPTIMQATPTLWRMLTMLDAWRVPDMTVLCGGEQLTEDLARELLGRCGRLLNLYGPTETTIWSTIDEITSDAEPLVTIGRPIRGTEVAVDMGSELDRGQRRYETSSAPGHTVGELLVAGAGVARGYWRRDSLTAERFVLRDGTRWYRSGDLARWRADGRLEWLGRRDEQIKVRGYRVEPGEIEATLRTHPAVADAAVVSDEHGRLIAVLVPHGPATASSDDAALTAFAASILPSYMVPNTIRWVERMPLKPSGKIDRRSLLRPEARLDIGAPISQ